MREIVQLPDAGPANVPLSPAIKADGVIYCSGQLPIDAKSGQVPSLDIREQTRQVLENLTRVLEAAGSTLANTLRVTVYMTDLKGFSQMNEVYRRFFPTDPPARTTIGVAGLARSDCLIEIDLIALS